MNTHVVKAGETLSAIAVHYGFGSWQELYEHQANAEFRSKRPDPDLIFPGDVINIPAKDEASAPPQPIPEQGDRGMHSGTPSGELSARQEDNPCIEMPVAPAIAADSFWVDQKRFAPARGGNKATFFVDGSDMMAQVAADIDKASSYIYLTDWAISPDVYLVRSGGLKPENTLLSRLKSAAKRGVVVRIMLWDSADKSPGGIDNHDIEAEERFEAAHGNIRVSRNSFHSYWSHHQKTIVIDGAVAYVGGIDLCAGRWDTPQHSVYADPAVFADVDFYNPQLSADQAFDKEGAARRNTYPRMPWHDVHLRVEGPSAYDVEHNFVQRWNYQRKSQDNESAISLASQVPSAVASPGHTVQIIRSVSDDSAGVKVVERSIQDAYIRAIKAAQHYIYIENQFFTSHFGTNTVVNGVADAIVARVSDAIDKKRTFRVICVIPVHPEGIVDTWSVQELMHWQYQTIIRSGANSLLGRIRNKLGKEDCSDYIGFFNLRNHAAISNKYSTEQIYVHAKLMIVDDRVVIAGSANINDRSLLGERDSELSATVVDHNTNTGQMDGVTVCVRSFAQDLRLQLWREHLGLSDDASIRDPVISSTYKDLWWKTAEENTAIYESVFPNIPRDSFATLDDQKKASAVDASKAGMLGGLKGHLTLYPLDYLEDEDLETGGYPDNIFTWYRPGFSPGMEVA